MQVWKSEVQSGKLCTGGKYKYGKFKYGYARMENASTENGVWDNSTVTGNTTKIILSYADFLKFHKFKKMVTAVQGRRSEKIVEAKWV